MTTTDELFNFPCKFPIKVITKREKDIEKTILDIIKPFAPDANDNAFSIRPSKNNKYWSITVTIMAQNKKQLDNIYQSLSDHDAIIMTL